MTRWMGVLTVWLAAAGCAGSPASVEPGDLAGRWEWQSSSGGIAGRTLTPATEGYSMELRLQTDGRAQLLKNGAVVGSADYQVGIGKTNGSFAGRDVVRFSPSLLGGWEEMGLSFPDATHLVLADGCCDGFTYSFTRVGSNS